MDIGETRIKNGRFKLKGMKHDSLFVDFVVTEEFELQCVNIVQLAVSKVTDFVDVVV